MGQLFGVLLKNFVKVQKHCKFHEIYLKCPKVGPLFEFFSQYLLKVTLLNAS